jgi:uroporphyrinogen decarboxylase
MRQFKGDTGHIFNLGHGITPDVDPENMAVFVGGGKKFLFNQKEEKKKK